MRLEVSDSAVVQDAAGNVIYNAWQQGRGRGTADLQGDSGGPNGPRYRIGRKAAVLTPSTSVRLDTATGTTPLRLRAPVAGADRAC